jgi:hypothetical protein
MPLMPKLPLLPDRQSLSTYMDTFFSRFWPIYPVIDPVNFEAEFKTIQAIQAASPESWQERVTLAHVPALVSAYAIISLGTNETSEDLELSFEYLKASHSLHGHLTAIPYLASVQSLFLLSLALRAAAKDGQAWHIIGHAVRMAQSFGLHKLHAPTSAEGLTAGPETETLSERVWWSCFALEKLMQLECGRPSILDRSYDSLCFYFPVDEVTCQALPYFKAWISLSSIMGRISNRLYSHRFQGGSAEMLGEVMRLDQELLGWAKSLPDSIKPCNTSTDHTRDEHRVISTFISQQYYHVSLPQSSSGSNVNQIAGAAQCHAFRDYFPTEKHRDRSDEEQGQTSKPPSALRWCINLRQCGKINSDTVASIS